MNVIPFHDKQDFLVKVSEKPEFENFQGRNFLTLMLLCRKSGKKAGRIQDFLDHG